MIEAHIRTKIQPWFNKLGYGIARYFTPNMITGVACIAGISAGFAIANSYCIVGLILLWFSGLCDVMDGTIARLTNTAQKVGAYIDLITDRIVESAVIIGFAYAYPHYHFCYLLFVIVVLLHFSTFLAVGALSINTGQKSMYYDHSIVERAEAFIVFTLMLLLPDYSVFFLMGFNTIALFDSIMRFYRVVQTK